MFIIILSIIATLMHGYLTWRIASLKWIDAEQCRLIWLASLLMWMVCMAGVRFGHNANEGGMALLGQLALNWLGVLFIATTAMFVLDLLTGFGLWAKSYLDHLRLGALAVATLLIAVALIQGIRPPVVTRYEVTLQALPPQLDGYRIAVLSDLHLGSQFGADWLAARAAQVEALKPDIIILLGDVFEGHNKPDPALQSIFAQMTAPLGIYAVTGNHEFFGNNEEAIAMSEKAGVIWLRNHLKSVAPGLSLVGVDDLSQHYKNIDNRDYITPLLQKRPEGVTLLLSHSPLQVEDAAAAGINLMLSGHTHNGQIWPFNYLVQYFYPYITGKYEIGDMTLIVSRGTGLWGPRMRLWRPAEIVEVTLRAAPPVKNG